MLCEEVAWLAAINEEELPDEGGGVFVGVHGTIASLQAVLLPNPDRAEVVVSQRI